jgi:hypothetical protein
VGGRHSQCILESDCATRRPPRCHTNNGNPRLAIETVHSALVRSSVVPAHGVETAFVHGCCLRDVRASAGVESGVRVCTCVRVRACVRAFDACVPAMHACDACVRMRVRCARAVCACGMVGCGACVRACVGYARVSRQRNVTYRRRPHKVQSCLLRRPSRPIKAIHRAQSRALLRARSARSLRHAANHVQEWGCPSHLGIVQLLRQRPHESCRALRSRCSIACGRAELLGLACYRNAVCASGCGCEHQVVNGANAMAGDLEW